MRVRYFGPFALNSGYSRACSDYLECLLGAGIDLDIVPIIDGQQRRLEDRYHNLLPYVNRPEIANDRNWPDVAIVHAIPYGCTLMFDEELAPGPSVKRVAITTWETSKLPEVTAHMLEVSFDQVWMPSRYSKDALDVSLTGVSSNTFVKVVPHAYDPSFWPSKAGLQRPNQPYTFYTVMTWCERKNPIGLLKAYLTEFGPDDNVLLKIKTPGYNESEIKELVRGLSLDYYPPVDMLCDYMSEDELRNLHIMSDCYVTVARAEGWGLGAFEAAIIGNPVIYSNYSGLIDFLDDYNNGFPIECFETPAYTPESLSNSEINISGLSIKPVLRNDHNGIRGDQLWAEPNIKQLKDTMRNIYNERPESCGDLDNLFNYETVGKLMKKNLEELCSL